LSWWEASEEILRGIKRAINAIDPGCWTPSST